MFYKIGVLKNLAKFLGKHMCWSYFLINLQHYLKEIPAELFSFEKQLSNSCEKNSCKNAFFTKHLQATAPVLSIIIYLSTHYVSEYRAIAVNESPYLIIVQ